MQVWLEAGREGQVFTYANPLGLELGCGDLVQLPLRGRRHCGLVVELLQERPAALEGRNPAAIEALQQPAAVDPHWQRLIEAVAHGCRTTPFRTLKAALPPGWLGQQRPGRASGLQRQAWLALESEAPAPWQPTQQQTRLLEALERQGERAGNGSSSRRPR